MEIKPTQLMLKKARNAAARIFAELKWRVKVKDLCQADLLNMINEAISETREKVKVAEIRDEAIKNYEKMIQMVNVVAGQTPRNVITKLNGE